MLQGITEMSLESSILCFAKGRKIGTLQKDKTPSGIRDTRMPSTVQGPFGGKVFCLHGMHWVSICLSFYTDNPYCWRVTNFKIACEELAKLSASQYFTNELCLVLGVNVILCHWIPYQQ